MTAFRSEEGFSLTYLPFISRAVVDALREFPHMNASVGEGTIVLHNEVHLGIAVDLNYEGLLAPVVRDAHDRRLRAIAREIHDLADRARTKKLVPDELAGGTFTLSNSGSFGTAMVIPIINQPQVAILSTDGVTRKPVVITDEWGNEAVGIHSVGQPHAVLGPPCLRRCVLGCVHGTGEGHPGDPRLGPGALRPVSATTTRAEPEPVRGTGRGLRVRWLGTVAYREAWSLQQALHRGPAGDGTEDDRLLLLEHPHVFTLGRNAEAGHVLVDPEEVGADLVAVDRGGDVTYHGPGQLVAYPVLHLPGKGGGGLPDVPAYVATLEQVLIDTLARARPARRRPPPRLPGRVGRPRHRGRPQDRGHRRAGGAGALTARRRPERGARPGLVRAHRAVRDRGVRGHVARGRRASTSRCATSSTPSPRPSHGGGSRPGWSGPTWCGATPRATSHRSAGGPGRERGPRARTPRSARRRPPPGVQADGTSVRLLGRLAEAGVAGGVALTDRKPEWMRARVAPRPLGARAQADRP